jgi:hypothetical protein
LDVYILVWNWSDGIRMERALPKQVKILPCDDICGNMDAGDGNAAAVFCVSVL